MCRILYLEWTNKTKALDYLDAFWQAWYHDTTIANVTKKFEVNWNWHQHPHGWGYLLVTPYRVNHYLSGKAFFEDKEAFKRLKQKIVAMDQDTPFLLMAEFRATDEWRVSALNSHPFPLVSYSWYYWWLFYNWLLDYKKLAQLEWIDFRHFEKKNGTLIMALTIAKELDATHNIQKALERPKKALKSWYNLMLFLAKPQEYTAYIHHQVSQIVLEDPTVYEYYKLIVKKDQDLLFAWSSNIAQYLPQNYELMKPWDTISRPIDWIKEIYINVYENPDLRPWEGEVPRLT